MSQHLALALAIQWSDDFRTLFGKVGEDCHLNPQTLGDVERMIPKRADRNFVNSCRAITRHYTKCIKQLGADDE